MRILVTDGEQRAALAVVRSLGGAGHEVIVVSESGRSLAGASRYASHEIATPDPLRDPEAFGEAIVRITETESIEALLPITEASLRVALPLRESLEPALLPFPDAEIFARASDKAALLDTARSMGIAVPEQDTLENPQDARSLALDFPVVLKPYVSVAREGDRARKLGVVHAATEGELTAALAVFPRSAYPILAQRRIVGPGVGIFLLRWNGATRAVFAHRRIREKPPSGGVSVYRESVAIPPAWVVQAERLLERFDWRGVAMVEFKLDAETDTPYLMEVNGRFWGSLQLAIDAGVDFPRLLIEAASGAAGSPPPVARPGIRLRWELGDLDHLLALLRRSRRELHLPPDAPSRLLAAASVLLPWRPGERWEVLRPSDPMPFFREAVNWARGG